MNPAGLDWSLCRTLLALLDEGSLSGAARTLGLTQPTVARQLDALEARLGVRLFVRSHRGLAATEVGLALRPYAASMAVTSAALLRAASAREGAVEGVVRISASEVVGVEVLPPMLAALRREHPGLVLELALSSDVDDLLSREADVAVRMVTPSQGALVARRVGTTALGMHAHPDYLSRRGVPASLDEMGAHDLIGFDRETPAMRAVLAGHDWINRASFALRAESDLAQLAAIRAGFGIGMCQVGLARRAPGLVRVLADAVSVALPTWIVMPEDLRASPRCRRVFDALVATMSRHLEPGPDGTGDGVPGAVQGG